MCPMPSASNSLSRAFLNSSVTATAANSFDLSEIERVFKAERHFSREDFFFIRSNKSTTALKLLARLCLEVSSLNSLSSFIRFVSSARSEEHTSELQSRENLVCRLL